MAQDVGEGPRTRVGPTRPSPCADLEDCGHGCAKSPCAAYSATVVPRALIHILSTSQIWNFPMNRTQVMELILQSLEHERGGVKIYKSAVAAALRSDLKAEWTHYLEQTEQH